jgi:hypothetical protein
MILINTQPHDARIRVGTSVRGLPSNARARVAALRRRPGPLGTSEWQEYIDGRRGPTGLYFQEVATSIVEHSVIRVNGMDIPCHRATVDQLRRMDATLELVPPSHLRLLNERRPQGFLLSDTAGSRGSLSFMGGVRPGADYRSTPDYNELLLIVITYGAFWNYRDLEICPTVLHEIGHIMTSGGEINYNGFDADRRQELEGTRVSRNRGSLEALCNVYMFFLCYGSTEPELQRFGTGFGDTREAHQKDAVARVAMRRCRAFRSPLLDPGWTERFDER